MIALCSMWDSNYHKRGLALLESLRRHQSDYAVCVLALDAQVFDYFQSHKQANVIAVSLTSIETPELREAKRNRTWVEFVWTLTPTVSQFSYDLFDAGSIAYLDADCFLFNDLAPLYAEVGNAPIAITPHRWTPAHAARLRAAGIYNVGWVYFTEAGLPCLDEWRRNCLEWCYWKTMEDGRFADQGYLNDWPQRWGAHVVQHLGANLAPWNQEQYTYGVNENGMTVSNGKRTDPLLFYHFHGYEGPDSLSGYSLHPMVRKFVYGQYIEATRG